MWSHKCLISVVVCVHTVVFSLNSIAGTALAVMRIDSWLSREAATDALPENMLRDAR